MAALRDWLDRVSEITGILVAWLTLPMVVGTFVIVVLRYAFDLGWIWMQESVVWLHAVVFMLAGAYTLKNDEHVRVDIFYRGSSSRQKAYVNLVGSLLFLVPTSCFLIWLSVDYVAVSWRIQEGSREAGGLPFPFVPVLKSTIPLAFALIVLQGVAEVIHSILTLAGSPHGRSPGSRFSARQEL